MEVGLGITKRKEREFKNVRGGVVECTKKRYAFLVCQKATLFEHVESTTRLGSHRFHCPVDAKHEKSLVRFLCNKLSEFVHTNSKEFVVSQKRLAFLRTDTGHKKRTSFAHGVQWNSGLENHSFHCRVEVSFL